MKSQCFLLALVFAMLGLTPAVRTVDAQVDRIPAWFDYACFDYPPDNELTLVEFYYGLLRHDMTFAFTDTGYVATAYIWVEISDVSGFPIDTLYKRIVTAVKTPEEMGKRNIRITDQIQATLKPGDYTAELIIEDAESQVDGAPMTGKTGQRRMKFRVAEFGGPELTMSDIELSYRINLLPNEVEASEYRAIDKSRRRVVPNPSRIFVNSDSILYFYGEVYNLAFGIGMNREFRMACRILDTHGGTVSDFGQRKHFKPGNSAIVSSALDIHDLPEGIYTLSLSVIDNETGDSATAEKPFQLLSGTPEVVPGKPADAFTQQDLELLRKVVGYHLTGDQKKVLKELSPEGKMRFYEDFWQRNDPDPDSRINEFKVELFRRYEYVNQHYSISIVKKDDGWQSDRGRVYMVYGEPDEIENYPSTLDLKPFEKWNYFSIGAQGPRFFIFEDETGYGDYRLVHSNANGETYSDEWNYLLERGRLLKH